MTSCFWPLLSFSLLVGFYCGQRLYYYLLKQHRIAARTSCLTIAHVTTGWHWRLLPSVSLRRNCITSKSILYSGYISWSGWQGSQEYRLWDWNPPWKGCQILLSSWSYGCDSQHLNPQFNPQLLRRRSRDWPWTLRPTSFQAGTCEEKHFLVLDTHVCVCVCE